MEATFLEIKNALEDSNTSIHAAINAVKSDLSKVNEAFIITKAKVNRLEKDGPIDALQHASDARPTYPSREAFESRSMSIGQDSLGGFLVAPDSPVWFARMRAQNVFMAADPVFVKMTSDSTPLPTLTASTTAAKIGEGGTITASDLSIGRSNLIARKFGCYTIASSEFLSDSNPAARDLIADDHVKTLANLIDLQIFEGSGAAGNIYGLRQDGTATSLGANGATVTIANIEALIYRAEAANCDMSRFHLFVHPRTWSTLRKELDGQLRYQLSPDPTAAARRQVFGIPVSVSSQITITETVGSSSDCSYVIGVDMSRVVVGTREGIGVLIDPYSRAQSDQVAVRTLTRVGFSLITRTAAQVLTGVRA